MGIFHQVITLYDNYPVLFSPKDKLVMCINIFKPKEIIQKTEVQSIYEINK